MLNSLYVMISSHVSYISPQKIKLLQAKIIELKKAFQRELVRVRLLLLTY